jgi:hypothetical protein
MAAICRFTTVVTHDEVVVRQEGDRLFHVAANEVSADLDNAYHHHRSVDDWPSGSDAQPISWDRESSEPDWIDGQAGPSSHGGQIYAIWQM